MADVTQLRFAQLVRRLLGLKAVDTGRAISPVFSATMDIQDAYRPESRALRGERSMTVGNQTTNIAANFLFNKLEVPAGGGRIFVWKRITLTFVLPTATNQPGNPYFFISSPLIQTVNPSVFGNYKDSRVTRTGATNQTSTGLGAANNIGATPVTTIQQTSVYFEALYPQATVTPTRLQIDNLDLVGHPGTEFQFGVIGDTLPVASWTYSFMIEGYEYIADPSELLPAAV